MMVHILYMLRLRNAKPANINYLSSCSFGIASPIWSCAHTEAHRYPGLVSTTDWQRRHHNIFIFKAQFQSLLDAQSLVLPYGSGTWTLLKAAQNKFQMRCLWWTLSVSLYDWLENGPLVREEIQKRRLQWFSQVCRTGMDVYRTDYFGENGMRSGRSNKWHPRIPGQNKSRMVAKKQRLSIPDTKGEAPNRQASSTHDNGLASRPTVSKCLLRDQIRKRRRQLTRAFLLHS